MSEPIGYQDGIAAFIAWLRKQPGVQRRGVGYDKADLSTWPWPDKLERTLRMLKDEHDAGVPAPLPPPPPPPPPPPTPSEPWDSGFAPQAYNQGSRGQNAKFNVKINCTLRGDGFYVDGRGIVYQDNGLCQGGRTETAIPELKPSDMSDGLEPWEPYVWSGVQIGPNKENYPARSYER